MKTQSFYLTPCLSPCDTNAAVKLAEKYALYHSINN